MPRILLILLLFSACVKKTAPGDGVVPPADINDQVETEFHSLNAVSRPINDATGGYYVALPSLYAKTTKTYPFILSFAGGGQAGDGVIDLPLLLNDGVMQLVDKKTFPPNFLVGGKNYSFIIFTPQFVRTPTAAELLSIIDFSKKNYRIDTTRFYLSGLSFGGLLSTEIAALDPSKYAALVPISNAFSDSSLLIKAQRIAAANLPVWSFHNTGDPVIPASISTNFINAIKSFNPAIAPKFTLFNSNIHDAWTQAINPSYKENNMNIYEFMLQYHR